MSAWDRLQANNAGSRASLNGISLCICKFKGEYSVCILVRLKGTGECAGGILTNRFFPFVFLYHSSFFCVFCCRNMHRRFFMVSTSPSTINTITINTLLLSPITSSIATFFIKITSIVRHGINETTTYREWSEGCQGEREERGNGEGHEHALLGTAQCHGNGHRACRGLGGSTCVTKWPSRY